MEDRKVINQSERNAHMKFKIFQASGASSIDKLEKAVNMWIEKQSPKIVDFRTAMATLGSAESELYQHFTMTVSYEDGSN